MTSTAAETASDLQARIQGQVITPADAQYEEARLAWNRSVNHHPALIVAVASASDVVETVRFARRQGLSVAVQATGHGIPAAADGALLLLTAGLRELRIDAQAQTAWIGAGLKWGSVLGPAQDAGLAPLLGSSSDVGAVGYTLGGGLGWLGRKYGMAADSVTAFELVNAEGELLRASAEENSEYYWGLRGGGGNFGVVTGMEMRLYPVEMVYAGNLFYPIEDAKAVMQRYREWVRAAPDELTTSVVLMNFPPIPQLPDMLRGKSFVMVRGCYVGSLDEGAAQLEYWRGWKAPLMDAFQPMPFREADRISSDPVEPMPSYNGGGWMRELSDDAIDTLISYAVPQGGPPPLTVVEVRHAGGAISRAQAVPGAYSRRDAELVLSCIAMTPTPEVYAMVNAYTLRLKQELGSAMTDGLYMNFASPEEIRQRAQDGYSAESYQQLQALKAKVDPQNVFRFGIGLGKK